MTTEVYLGSVLIPYLILAAAALILVTRCDRGVRVAVTRCLFFAMLASEIVKQVVAVQTHVWITMVPLHFSSTFYLSVGLSVFAKKFFRHAGQVLLFVGGVLMTGMIFVNPIAVLGDPTLVLTSHIRAHGYFYHMAVAFQLFVLLFSREYSIRYYDAHIFALFVAFWGAIAIPGAFYFKMNFMGILVSYIPFLEKLRLAAGYPLYLTVYYALLVLAVCAFLFVCKKLTRIRIFPAKLPLYKK